MCPLYPAVAKKGVDELAHFLLITHPHVLTQKCSLRLYQYLLEDKEKGLEMGFV